MWLEQLAVCPRAVHECCVGCRQPDSWSIISWFQFEYTGHTLHHHQQRHHQQLQQHLWIIVEISICYIVPEPSITCYLPAAERLFPISAVLFRVNDHLMFNHSIVNHLSYVSFSKFLRGPTCLQAALSTAPAAIVAHAAARKLTGGALSIAKVCLTRKSCNIQTMYV